METRAKSPIMPQIPLTNSTIGIYPASHTTSVQITSKPNPLLTICPFILHLVSHRLGFRYLS